MKIIFSISGGGMRGIGSAAILALIEKYAARPIGDIADLITGTSTGAILASLAANPAPLPAATWGKFYREAGPRIFRKGWIPNLRWAVKPKYRGDILHAEIAKAVGPWHLDEAGTRLMIPTIDADRIEARFLKSWDIEDSDWTIAEAATASSSAQTYFPAFKKNGTRYIDGGSHSNNPSACALFEAIRLWPREEIVIVSIGTGRQANPKPLPDGGLTTWATLLFGTCSETQDDVARYFCTHAPGVKSYTFDFTLPTFPGMDDASKATLDAIEQAATHSLLIDWQSFESLLATIARHS